jgi:predicted glycogen debranching enzyme
VLSPAAACEPSSPPIRKLMRAANDFVVYRKTPDGKDGTSILAGYPWFADWGRDTFISLPGLLLATRRFEQARQVLTVFASYVSEGMIPNRFDDYSNEPSYNTVDASLWFIHSAFEYFRLSNDYKTFEQILQPACRAIVHGYRRGTRYKIRMDERDGLVTQGDATTQLTWMDAKCGDIAFTPRHGKAVEINALWYRALVLMGEKALAEQCRASFRAGFWISPFRGLADVIDGDAPATQKDIRRDTSIRPNQIFAVSLSDDLLTREQQSAVVEVVRRELLTPYGLRTLARDDPNYHREYKGTQAVRDAAYHNGIVWPWPLGAFLEAYLKVNDRSKDSVGQAKQWLAPLIMFLDSAVGGCVGQLPELFEPEEPCTPKGCFAQAWSVAETLRLAVMLGLS